MATKRLAVDLNPKVTEILKQAERYHRQFYAVKTFGGPSLYFHRRALGQNGGTLAKQRSEIIYAVLSSWGMHRMGKGGSKMQPFDIFDASIRSVGAEVTKAKRIAPALMTESDWALIEFIFKRLKVMESKTSIVGHSKVMAHLLPNVIAPVDREYTLKFLFGNGTISNNLNSEWLLMRKIHEEFFFPIANNKQFHKQASTWLNTPQRWPWDTSPLKIIDNLVIGAMKS